MAVFVMVGVLALLGVVLLGPLMLPGAVVVFVALAVANIVQHHHAARTVRSH